MTKTNPFLRKVTAIFLCICMLLGNIGVASSDTVEIISDPVMLTSAGEGSTAADKALLSTYVKFFFDLKADVHGTPLPEFVENGQSLYFTMNFELLKDPNNSELLLLKEAYKAGEIDSNTTFVSEINFLPFVENSNYPTSFDSRDNAAIDSKTGMTIFHWWVDEASSQIHLRFTDDILSAEGQISGAKVAFSGELVTADKDDNGELHFGVDNQTQSLKTKQEYDLAKTAGVPHYSVDAGAYVVDYTVTLTLDRDMELKENASNMYAAVLALEDTVTADSALTGEIFGTPAVTAPEGETVTVATANNGKTNTMTFASPDQVLKKGTYTVTYQMKVESDAALAKLNEYSDAQKTNTVEVKENGASLAMPLTADAMIAWDEVTENQFKIEKNAFTEKAPYFKGVYWDEKEDKYYIDYRVVVYVKEPVSTFTVTDQPNFSLSFRTANNAPTLEGVDQSDDYWNNDISTAELTTFSGANAPVVSSTINDKGENVITVTAPEGQMLQPGAYHLRVPADVTGAVETTMKNSYPQSYKNTAYLTSVDGAPTNEKDEFQQAIPNRTEPDKAGGYEVDKATGELLFYNGKPVIRWDVWFGWDFYDVTTFVDTLTGMELLVNDNYPFEIHSFTDKNHHVKTLASLKSLTDTNYLDFNEDGTGFTFEGENLNNNPDGSPVKLYKMVYFSTPLEDESGTGYVTSGIKNNYVVTHTTQSGDGFGTGPITGEAEPELTSNGRLYVSKRHVIELNNSLTQWKITCSNTQNKIPFARLSNLDIIDLVPRAQEPIGEVTIHYSDDHPIVVDMFCDNNKHLILEEGTHYNIVKQLDGYDFGENGKYGFAVDLNMEAVAALMEAEGVVYFKTIDVLCYLENEIHPSGQNYRIKNDGWLDYTTLGVELTDGFNAQYDRGFATMWKGVHDYNDNYNPNSPRRWYVCNVGADGKAIGWQNFTGGYNFDPQYGDGQKELVWRIYVGAREFGNDPNPITVTITDSFSDNQMFPTYKDKELKDQFQIRAYKNSDYFIIPDSVELIDDNTFTLTFTVPGGEWAGQYTSSDIYIDYHTILKPEAIKEALDNADENATQVTINYSNTANAGWNGENYDIPTKTASHTFSTKMLEKSASIVTAVSEIEYSIVINENRLMLNNGRPLVLTDELGSGEEYYLYRDDSIMLVNLDTGAELSAGSSVTENTYTINWAKGDTKGFTISVPDGRRLELTYRVKPQTGVGSEAPALTNSASLDGKTDTHQQDRFMVVSSNQEATFVPDPDTVGIIIRKLEGNSSIEEMLPGAVFTAYPVLNTNGDLGEPAGSWTTDATGKAALVFKYADQIGYKTVYCIKETAAPAGYQADDSEWYFYFSTTSKQYDSDEVQAIVEALRGQGKSVQEVKNENTYTLNVENLPITCDLHIYKESASGQSLDGAVFTLTDEKGSLITGPVITEENGVFTYAYTGLKGGNYTLTEIEAPDGYQLSSPNQWNITLDSVGKSVAVNWPEGTNDTAKAYVSASSQNGVPALTVKNDVADDAQLEIPVVKVLEDILTTTETFTFKLWAVEDDAPMPAGTDENGECFVTTSGAAYDADGKATVLFPAISFGMDDIGQEFNYCVTEEAVAENTGFLMEDPDACYQLTVRVIWDDAENKIAAQIVDIADKGGLPHTGELEFVNRYNPTISLNGQKYWNDNDDAMGVRPETIAIRVMNGQTVVQSCETSAEAGWAFQFDDLQRFDAEGNEINYTLEEVLPEAAPYQPEYSAITEADGVLSGNITNHQMVKHTIVKDWDDNENQDGVRPAALDVTLTRKLGDDTLEIGTYELNEANGWTVTVSQYSPDSAQPDVKVGLPACAPSGEAYEYVWTEETVVGYTASATPVVTTEEECVITTLKNTHTPELTEATVKKVWNDATNQDGKRPGELTVTLSDGQTVTLNAANNWEATITDLPKYANGTAIVYSWTEEELPEGYTMTGNTTEGTVTTITNSYTPKVTEATVKKVWNDATNQDGKRPEELTVTLSNGRTVTLNAENNWEATITGLPKYANGTAIVYSWTEAELPEGYTMTGNTTEGTVTTITNSYTPELTEATVKKVWNDATNQDGKRPGELTVTLSNGQSVTLNAANNWEATITGLPKYAAGTAIVYSWTEEELPEGYTMTGNTTEGTVTTITNSYTPDVTEATVKKVWNDATNQDGKRPGELTVTLSNGQTVTLNAANNWEATITGLPKYANGVEIEYTWTEDETTLPEGYTMTGNTTEGNVTTITNSYTPKVTEATVKKVWDDATNQDGKRPGELAVTLSNGQSVTLNAANNWEATITDLPKYANGVEIEYTWTEDETTLPEGYTMTGNTTEGTVTTITNSYTPELTEATVKKVWDDAANQDGKRPGELTVTLSNGQTVTLNAANNWEATITGLPKYAAGTAIVYSWTEAELPEGYTMTGNTTEGTVTTITNSYMPELTEATVKKVWNDATNQDGKRPGELTVTLNNGQSVTLNAENNWEATITGLPKYANGVEIEYTWTEDETTLPEGYTMTSNTTEGTVTTITNSYTPELTEATVKKVWDDATNQDGKRPGELAVTLNNGQTVTLNAANDWEATITDLPKYANGTAIVYSWTEAELPEGYSMTSNTTEGTVTTITNSYTPETLKVSGSKIWNDADNQDGKRPKKITVNLLANGVVADSLVVEPDADGQWTWCFVDLYRYKDGKEIAYSVTETLDEAAADAYTATVNGYDIVNTHEIETLTISGKKTWDDMNNLCGKRPESVTIRLYADGTEIAQQQVDATSKWSWSFTDLPKYAAGMVGHELTYTITEDPVSGYETTLNGYDVTNSLLAVAFQKVDEQTGLPLAGAKFALYEGRLTSPKGTMLDSWTSNGVPKVLSGLTIGQTYTIFETRTPGGYVTMKPFVFTVQETDTPANLRTFTANNQHFYRFRKLSSKTGELVLGALMAIKQGDTVIATWYTNEYNDGWYHVVDSRFKPGVVYTLVELEAPVGYQLAAPVSFMIDPADGLLIIGNTDTDKGDVVMYDQPVPAATPTPEPTTTSFVVTKQWMDRENVLGLRPDHIVVNLYRKTSNEAAYPDTPYLTVTINSNGRDEWKFTFSDLPRKDSEGRLYTYMAQEEAVDGYVTTYLNNGRTIVNAIPEEDFPPTPTPTLPYVTPTPSPMPRTPAGVQFVNGKWVYVDEYGIPLGTVPLTGDNTNFVLWGAAVLLPLVVAALAAVEIRRRKRRMAMEK